MDNVNQMFELTRTQKRDSNDGDNGQHYNDLCFVRGNRRLQTARRANLENQKVSKSMKYQSCQQSQKCINNNAVAVDSRQVVAWGGIDPTSNRSSGELDHMMMLLADNNSNKKGSQQCETDIYQLTSTQQMNNRAQSSTNQGRTGNINRNQWTKNNNLIQRRQKMIQQTNAIQKKMATTLRDSSGRFVNYSSQLSARSSKPQNSTYHHSQLRKHYQQIQETITNYPKVHLGGWKENFAFIADTKKQKVLTESCTDNDRSALSIQNSRSKSNPKSTMLGGGAIAKSPSSNYCISPKMTRFKGTGPIYNSTQRIHQTHNSQQSKEEYYAKKTNTGLGRYKTRLHYVRPSYDRNKSPVAFSVVLGQNKLNSSTEVDSEIRRAFNDLGTTMTDDDHQFKRESGDNSQTTFDNSQSDVTKVKAIKKQKQLSFKQKDMNMKQSPIKHVTDGTQNLLDDDVQQDYQLEQALKTPIAKSQTMHLNHINTLQQFNRVICSAKRELHEIDKTFSYRDKSVQVFNKDNQSSRNQKVNINFKEDTRQSSQKEEFIKAQKQQDRQQQLLQKTTKVPASATVAPAKSTDGMSNTQKELIASKKKLINQLSQGMIRKQIQRELNEDSFYINLNTYNREFEELKSQPAKRKALDDSELKRDYAVESKEYEPYSVFPDELFENDDFRDFLQTGYKKALTKEQKSIIDIINMNSNMRNKKHVKQFVDWCLKVDILKDKSEEVLSELINNSTVMNKLEKGDSIPMDENKILIIYQGNLEVQEFSGDILKTSILYKYSSIKPNIHKNVINKQCFCDEKEEDAQICKCKKTVLIALDKEQYDYLLKTEKRKEMDSAISFLTQMKIFMPLSYEKLDYLAAHADIRTLKKGEVIVSKDSFPLDFCYFVQSGHVKLQKVVKVKKANFMPTSRRNYERRQIVNKDAHCLGKIMPLEYYGILECLMCYKLDRIECANQVAGEDNTTIYIFTKEDLLRAFSIEQIGEIIDQQKPKHTSVPENQLILKSLLKLKMNQFKKPRDRILNHGDTPTRIKKIIEQHEKVNGTLPFDIEELTGLKSAVKSCRSQKDKQLTDKSLSGEKNKKQKEQQEPYDVFTRGEFQVKQTFIKNEKLNVAQQALDKIFQSENWIMY